MQMSVIEMFEEPNKPLYHLENYIEGNYVKYNSNSGFVSDEARATPQVSSHSDLSTDPHLLLFFRPSVTLLSSVLNIA